MDLEIALKSYFGLSYIAQLASSCSAGDSSALWPLCEGKTKKVWEVSFCLKSITLIVSHTFQTFHDDNAAKLRKDMSIIFLLNLSPAS